MISLKTNISDLILQRTLFDATFGLNNAIERMTTGYKVNHAKDNAAGYSIIEDLNTRISSMLQVQNNTEDGISLLSTAQGGLEEISKTLQKLRELTLQTANGTYDEQSLQAMQAQADEMVASIEQIQNSISYDGNSLYGKSVETNASPISQSLSLNRQTFQTSGLSSTETNIPEFTLQENQSLEMTSYPVSGVDNMSAPDNFSLNQPMMSYAVSPMSLDDGVATASTDDIITGAYDFAANSTTTIQIDGVSYTVTNSGSSANSLSYSKNKTTGELTLMCSSLKIVGQDGVEHNLIIEGSSNVIHGGNLDDKFTIENVTSIGNHVHGNAGNDEFIIKPRSCYIYGEAGDDVFTTTSNYTTIYGGDGDNIYDVSNNSSGSIIGGNGIDDITLKNNTSVSINANGGDDIITLDSNCKNITVNGGTGTNTLNDSGTNTTAVNVIGANAFLESFGYYETKTLTINGKEYTITNNSSAKDVIWSVDNSTGEIIFKTNNITINAQENVEHNVRLDATNINYYGGNLTDIVTTNKGSSYILSGGGDDYIYGLGSVNCKISTGEGCDYVEVGYYSLVDTGIDNDIVEIKQGYSSINIGDGDDIVKLYNANTTIEGGIGNDIIESSLTDLSKALISGFGEGFDNAQTIDIGAKETKTVTINGCSYTIKNESNIANKLFYSYSPVTGQLSLGGGYLTITADRNVLQNVKLQGSYLNFYGSNYADQVDLNAASSNIYLLEGDDVINNFSTANQNVVYAGEGNDTITNNYAAIINFYGEAGDDVLICNTGSSSTTLNGGIGNDTYHINSQCKVSDDEGNNIYYVDTNSATITSNTGADTFYVNGNNNNIDGAGGNDYFVIKGENNTIKGGTGNNLYIDGSSGTSNITQANPDPDSGIATFNSLGETKTISIGGKSYTVVNNSSSSNDVLYYYNANTDIITFEGDDLIITSIDNQENDIIINGSNNTYNGSNLVDKVAVESGTNNIIKTNAGNDNIKVNTENNTIDSGSGNDKIEANKTCVEIRSGSGNDVLVINSNNNAINTGDDNDIITLNGKYNTVELNGGQNNITLKGENNIITAGDGANTFSIQNDSNTIILGDGNNTLNVGSENNNINLGFGNNNINIYANNNEINAQSGSNKVLFDGNSNKYTAQGGSQNVEIEGNQNEIDIADGELRANIKGDNNIVSNLGDTNIKLHGDSNQFVGGNKVDATIVGNSNELIGGSTNDTFIIKNGNSNVIDGAGGARNVVIDFGSNSQITNAVITSQTPFELNVKVGIGNNSSAYVSTEISFESYKLFVDLSSRENALDSLNIIDELISDVNNELLNIGSMINRLQMVQEEQNIKLENMISSRSTLRDADIAEVSSDYIKKQILQNASATLLASSRNLRYDNVIGLLDVLRFQLK